MSDAQSPKTPWHVWVVGLVSLLWNLGGVMDFVMTQTKNEDYLKQVPIEHVEFINNFETWAIAVWGTAVFAAFLGSLLILLRKKAAATVFIVGFVSLMIMTFRNFVLENGMDLLDNTAAVMTVAIVVIGFLLILYTRAMASKGVLR